MSNFNNFNRGPEQRMDAPYNRYNRQTVNEENKYNMNGNDYNSVYDPSYNKQWSVSQESSVMYELREDYLIINSGSRDNIKYPNSCQFVLELNEHVKNICQIELIQAVIPDKGEVQKQPYLLLKIDELENVMLSNDKYISESFAMIQIAQPVLAGYFIHCDKRINEYVKLHYRTPKASLNKMTVSLTDPLGTVFDFGASGSLDPRFQCQFIIKVTSKESNRSKINQINVY